VAETTPKPPLGVVLATHFAPWGWPLCGQGVGRSHPKFFFEKYFFSDFFLNKKFN
jgi:hypothetical protein